MEPLLFNIVVIAITFPAWVGSIDIATKKARTPFISAYPVEKQVNCLSPVSLIYGIEHSNDGMITFPGGVPIVDDEAFMSGAIGVNGSSVENDDLVAHAGAEIINVCDLPEHLWRT
ncbi:MULTISPECIES: heme-binding protein [unclassified Methylophaga]|uniref:GlcG/HbpS family heme-binding protein n=1 Tax=unclassified Methylophaga TaxID=2629249 RepID=UPI002600315C|nr:MULTISPECIES: heme-binding protein [unclassified Methylophaga]